MFPAGCLDHLGVAKAWREYATSRRWQRGAVVWRAEALTATEGQPMTRRRALALNAVLAHGPLPVMPGELLVGIGNLGRWVAEGTYSEARLTAAQAVVDRVGERGFHSHANHHAGDYALLLRLGFGGLRDRVRAHLPQQDAKGQVFLESVLVALDGASEHLRRWVRPLSLAAQEFPDQGSLLRYQAAMLERLADAAPATFWEALQVVYLYHCMMQLDDRAAMALGRLDQYLYPFYQADLEAGRLTADEAQALLDHLFAKITIDEDVQNIVVAGTRPADGADATNPLSYHILEACKRIGRPGGNCTARLHAGTPDAFIEKCAEVIRTGIGYPAVTNETLIIRGLVEHGYPLEDARDYCCVGCIETQIQGKQGPWADGRANPLHALNLALFRGVDSLSGKQVGPDTGEPATFEDFYQAFITHAHLQIRQLIAAADSGQRPHFERAEEFTAPLLSALVSDCMARGRDVNDGGARYPGCFGFGSMGIASIADSLAALRQFVYEEQRFSLDEVRAMLRADFVGCEAQRQLLLRGAPKFGNDIEAVDSLAARVVVDLAAEYRRHRTPEGGHYFMLMGSNVQNIAGGHELGATPDGRKAGTPISDASSPTFGRDVHGPTAAIRSLGRIPYHLAVGGNVVNMKLDPSALAGAAGLRRLAALIRTCFELGGQELQFNTTDSRVLRDAMGNPEQYASLVVRVSGFSATYVHLDRSVQQDILSRTEHRLESNA
jgi:formate C-acetyltransferase